MQNLKLIRRLYRLRRFIAVVVLIEWLYKAHKSAPALWLTQKYRQKRNER